MEQGYDEELEKLLGEIPGATSAPPHQEEVQTAQQQQHSDAPQQSSYSGNMLQGETRIMSALNNFPHQFKPLAEQNDPSSQPIGSHARDNSPDSIIHPAYSIKHLEPSVQHDVQACHHTTDSELTSNGILMRNILDRPDRTPLVDDFSLSLQGDSRNTKVGMKSRDYARSSSEVSSMLDSPISSRLPSSLQLVDPFTYNSSQLLESELSSDFGKVSLMGNRLTMENQSVLQPSGMHFLHHGQEVSQLTGQTLMEPTSASNVNAVTMQLGFQQVMMNEGHPTPLSAGMLSHYPSDLKMIYSQPLHGPAAAAAAHAQQQLEERIYCRQRIKEEFLLRQQKMQEQQARFYASLHNPSGPLYSRRYSGSQLDKSPGNYEFLPRQPSPKATVDRILAPDGIQSTHGMWASPVMPLHGVPQASDVCQYFLQGFCPRGDSCPFPHSCSSGIPIDNKFIASDTIFSCARKGPRNTQIASSPVLSSSMTKSMIMNGHLLCNSTHLPTSNCFGSMNGDALWKGINPEILQQPVNSQNLASQQQSPPAPKYNTLKDIQGHIYGIAKDQHGCRFLQKKFEEGAFEDVQKIFIEIIDHVVELMTDPFGNYLVQKLLEVCDEAQRMEILYRVCGNSQLVTISLNMHGTRAVQKLIETLKTPEQVALVISSLRQGIVVLIKDLNGNHVVQRCLQRFSTEDSQFIFDAAALHCVEIATHRHGCCVLQRCVDYSTGQQRECLVAEIASNALILSQDPFGNYVVQYILDLGLAWAIADVISRLDGNFVHLAMQKFSSNVVEKCLKLGGEESKARIIQELTSSTRLAQLLQDPFANYVVQCALTVSKGSIYAGLVEAIRPHLPALRSSPYGKRILSRTSLKK